LHHGDRVVAEGAFEILCWRGDEAVFFFIAEFFREQSRLLVREAEQHVGGGRFVPLIGALHEYLKRYGDFYPQLRPDIVALLDRAGAGDWGGPLRAMMNDLEISSAS
jgi:hypothetical protein